MLKAKLRAGAALILLGVATLAFADGQVSAPNGQPSGAATAPASGQGSADSKPANDPDEVICKREQVTGTRVARQKICMTRREWDEEADESRSRAHREQEKQDADGRTARIGPD